MLRTSSELIRYGVKATDGSIGSVADLLFDDRNWKVRSIVVDTGNFLRHHEVLIDPMSVQDMKFPEETMVLGLSKRDVEAAPGIETSPPVSQQSVSALRDIHLRSSNETCAYTIAASDAEMGKIHGFVIETSTWTIRYLIVDTGEWLMGKLVLLGPHAIRSIDWSSHTMKANVTADVIRHSPVYDETAEVSRDYEAFLHDYYGWPHYWL
jgi:uncharacterized protein YrrD